METDLNLEWDRKIHVTLHGIIENGVLARMTMQIVFSTLVWIDNDSDDAVVYGTKLTLEGSRDGSIHRTESVFGPVPRFGDP